jgi:GNAT superfamily N-acetyltransferase
MLGNTSAFAGAWACQSCLQVLPRVCGCVMAESADKGDCCNWCPACCWCCWRVIDGGCLGVLAGIAYVSNVAVAPEVRRAGVARRMMQEAEQLAAQWGFRAVGLHCNAKNTAAVELYKSLGYKQTVLEPVWMPWVQGRPPDRCHFMLKRLPAHMVADAKTSAAAVEAQQGSGADSSTEGGQDRRQEGEPALAAGPGNS